MTRDEILDWLEAELRGYPERATGNECADFVAGLAGSVIASDRAEFVEAMREWIARPGNRTLFAVKIAADYGLRELRPDVQILLEGVRAGRVLQPYYEEMIAPYLRRLTKASDAGSAQP